MSDPALIASRAGAVTDGLPAIVAARGFDPVETLVTNQAEDGALYLPPATVERIEERVDDEGGAWTLVVDGTPHPGQLADLGERLHPVRVGDTRQVVWERLAEENPVAATRVELRAARVEARLAAASQRDAATRGPSGTSGRLDEAENRRQSLRETLERQRERARRRVRRSHTDATARVVVLGRVGAPTTPLWTALTGAEGPSAAVPGRPTRPRTATASVGPHTVAVTDTPGVPGRGGLPAWLTETVPGMETALEDADCVLGVGSDLEALETAVVERFDAPWRSLADATPRAARTVVESVLESEAYAVRLPYGDESQALVSRLHDDATVREVEYDDAVYLRVAVPASATDDLRRRVTAVDGDLRPLDDGE